jgi:hypothetical protein
MGNSKYTPVENDPQELQRAHAMWANFTQVTKWSIIGISGLLFVMYLGLIVL